MDEWVHVSELLVVSVVIVVALVVCLELGICTCVCIVMSLWLCVHSNYSGANSREQITVDDYESYIIPVSADLLPAYLLSSFISPIYPSVNIATPPRMHLHFITFNRSTVATRMHVHTNPKQNRFESQH